MSFWFQEPDLFIGKLKTPAMQGDKPNAASVRGDSDGGSFKSTNTNEDVLLGSIKTRKVKSTSKPQWEPSVTSNDLPHEESDVDCAENFLPPMPRSNRSTVMLYSFITSH